MRDIRAAGALGRRQASERHRNNCDGSNSESFHGIQHDWPLGSIGLSPRPENGSFALRRRNPLNAKRSIAEAPHGGIKRDNFGIVPLRDPIWGRSRRRLIARRRGSQSLARRLACEAADFVLFSNAKTKRFAREK